MTGLSETEDIVKGLDAGGVDYVTKPIVPDELLARIRVHLANARVAHGARTALDTLGRFLLAANRAGRMLWCTPQAAKLLAAFQRLPDRRRSSCRARSGMAAQQPTAAPASSETLNLSLHASPLKLELSFVGQIGPMRSCCG